MKKLRFLLYGIILVLGAFLFWKQTSYASEVAGEDKIDKKVIRVGFFYLNGFYDYGGDGELSGYGVDLMDKIAEKTGWDYEFIKTDDLKQGEELLKDGKIDLLAPVSEKEEESAGGFLCSRYMIGKEYKAVLTKKSRNDLVYEDFERFNGLVVGCLEDDSTGEDLKEYGEQNGFEVKEVYYPTEGELRSALKNGEVDAITANLLEMDESMKQLVTFPAVPCYYMYQEGERELGEELDRVLGKIYAENSKFTAELEETYFSVYEETPFTKAEQDYVKQKQQEMIKVGYVTDMDPVSYQDLDTNKASGITKDIMGEVSCNSGFIFSYVPLPKGEISLDYLLENGIDLVTGVEEGQKGSLQDFQFTIPYLKSKKIFVGKKGAAYYKYSRFSMALVKGPQTVAEEIREKYPNIKLVYCESIEDCMEAILKGKADVMIQNQYTVECLLEKPRYEGLSIIPMEGLQEDLCICIVPEKKSDGQWKIKDDRLISILDKSISGITEEQKERIIINQTTGRPYQFTTGDIVYRYRYPVMMLVVVTVIGGGIGIYAMVLRRRNEAIIRSSESRLYSITNNINGGVLVFDIDDEMKIDYVNEGFLELIRYKKTEKKEKDYRRYIVPEDQDKLDGLMEQIKEGKTEFSVHLSLFCGDGERIEALFNGTVAEGTMGERLLYCVVMDMTRESRIMEQLELEQKRYEIVTEKSDEIIYEMDLTKGSFHMSGGFEKKFGWKLPEWEPGNRIAETVKQWKVHEEDKAIFLKMASKLRENKGDNECIIRIFKEGEGFRWCCISQYSVLDRNGNLASVVGKVADVDAEMKEKERLKKMSLMDEMTGLYNKKAFYQLGQEYLEKKPAYAAVIFMDLDNFKSINDLLGHMTGDDVIREAAQKIQRVFDKETIIARFGGDEYCLLVKEEICMAGGSPKTEFEPFIKEKLRLLLPELRQTYQKNDKSVGITSSIGVAFYEKDGDELTGLSSCADMALYYAKENGKNQFVCYSRDIKLNGYKGR